MDNLSQLIKKMTILDKQGLYKACDKITSRFEKFAFGLPDSPRDYRYQRGEEDEVSNLDILIRTLWPMIAEDPDWDNMSTYENLVNQYNSTDPVFKVDTEDIITSIWDANKKGDDVTWVTDRYADFVGEEYKGNGLGFDH